MRGERGGKRESETRDRFWSIFQGDVNFPLRRHVAGSENAAAALASRGMPVGAERKDGKREREE